MEKINKNIIKYLQEISSKNKEDILKLFSTSLDGLSEKEVDLRLGKYRENEITYKKDTPWYVYLFKSFLDPFVLILLVIVIISYFTDVYFPPAREKSWMTIGIISLMIFLSVVIEFYQEYSSKIAADKLKNLVRTRASVKRDGLDFKDVDMRVLVPGDIVHLAAGDLVPADIRILSCQDLFINQSALTGESITIEKKDNPNKDSGKNNIEDLNNICLMGTIVVSGSGIGVVVETGNETYFGTIAESISEDRGETSFEKGVRSVSMLLIRFMLIMVPIVFLINGISKKNWLEAFLFSISIAVGLTPEMLPTIVSSNLAKGATSLAKKKIVVKRLNSIQNFGAMNILCTDKTGTLTIDQIVLEDYLNVKGEPDDRVLRHGYLNSFFQTGLKNLMDKAVIKYGNNKGLDKYKDIYEKIDEIPFDFERRRMSVVLRDKEGKRQLITKGAIEEILSISSFIDYKGRVEPLTDDIKESVLRDVNQMNLKGMRVLGISQKNHIPDVDIFSVKDESDMVLIGYMGFLDPPKESAKPAINALIDHGVDVKVLTGDNEFIASKICNDVGIFSEKILLGNQVENMTDKELSAIVEDINIFAKMSPMQKERVIRVLQENDNVVGFLGDGINDAPALKKSDIGISVDTAVDIAKESADMILLEKDLKVLEEGVVEGRRVFGNIIKYIKMTASSNFGNVFSVLVASAFLPFLPMLPLQLLIQNLLYSISQIAIPWDNMDKEYLSKPQRWNAKEIGHFMVYIGPISSIFDIATYLVMWFVFKANTLEAAPLFQSGWFLVGLLTQTLVVHLLRTEKLPFIESRASAPLMVMTFIIVGVGLVIPFTGFGSYLGFVHLPLGYFPWMVGIILAYCIVTELAKKLYIKKFNTWL